MPTTCLVSKFAPKNRDSQLWKLQELPHSRIGLNCFVILGRHLMFLLNPLHCHVARIRKRCSLYPEKI